MEFLVTPDGNPYLIEINTRLQVEHGITESRYGIDLVEEQIAIAFGAELRYREEELRPSYYCNAGTHKLRKSPRIILRLILALSQGMFLLVARA